MGFLILMVVVEGVADLAVPDGALEAIVARPDEDRLVGFKGRHLVSVDDFSRRELEFIYAASFRVKRIFKGDKSTDKERKSLKRALAGVVPGLIQLEPSTRTFGSFKRAGAWLGAELPFEIVDPKCSSFIKHESLSDALRTLYEQHGLGYVVIRSSTEGMQRYASMVLDKYAASQGGRQCVVINAGDGTHEHPTQAILDAVTILEQVGRLDHLKVVLQGDLHHSRTIHSLLKVLLKYPGNEYWGISHPKFALPEDYQDLIRSAGSKYHEADAYSKKLLSGKDIACLSRPQAERFKQMISDTEKEDYMRALTLTSAHLPQGDLCPRFLHALPIDETFGEVEEKVKDHPRFVAFKQAGNGTGSRMAELLLFLGVKGWGDELPEYVPPADASADIQIKRIVVPYDPDRLRHHIIGPIKQGWVFDKIPDDWNLFMKIYEILGPPKGMMCDGRVKLEKEGSRRLLHGDYKYIAKRDYDLPIEVVKRVLALSSIIRANKVKFMGDKVEYHTKDSKARLREVGAVTEKWSGFLSRTSRNVYDDPNLACVSRLKNVDSLFVLVDPQKGLYRCAYCDTPLLTSKAKFKAY